MNLKSYLQLLITPNQFISQKINENTQKIENLLRKDHFYPIQETQENDIFVAGYPKSGNTWVQSIIAGLIYAMDTSFLSDKLAQEIVPDVHDKKYYKRFSDINFFKTHHLPKPEYKRVIYLVRDGRDSLVSYYAMKKNLSKDVSLDSMVIEGKALFPCKWNIHVSEWLNNPYKADMIIVKYEELINNPISEVQKICDFAGLNRTQEVIEQVMFGNSIDKMRARAEKYGMNHTAWQDGKAPKFFRKGQIGGYKEEMSQELQDYFVKESEKELRFFGYL